VPKRLVRMTPDEIMEGWKPGLQEGIGWTWHQAYNYMHRRDKERTAKLAAAIVREGFGLADSSSPIKLGSDGRVQNGHHRIVIAMDLKPEFLMVELEEEKRSTHGRRR
jgi:hypothetical protein